MSEGGPAAAPPPLKWDPNKVWKEQDFQVSTRLTLQHWIWSRQLNYTLHPTIDFPVDAPLRIADIGCGNGAWMIEIGREFPQASLIQGFDITASNFPAVGHLSSTPLKFDVWDAFTPLPDEFEGAFDIVHVRALYSAIIDNNVQPVVENALRMLAPGGYLQWDEQDASTLGCVLPAGSPLEAPSTKAMVEFMNVTANMSKMFPGWLHDMPRRLAAERCEVLAEEHTHANPLLHRAWCDNMLTIWWSVAPMIPEQAFPLPASPGGGLPRAMDRKTYLKLWEASVDECRRGALISMEQVVVVARKQGAEAVMQS